MSTQNASNDEFIISFLTLRQPYKVLCVVSPLPSIEVTGSSDSAAT